MFPENAAIVEAFLICATQWRWIASAHVMVATSLDYVGCEAAFRMADIIMTKEIFLGLQVMETAAISAMSERGK